MRGMIKWMAENHVAANILMFILVGGGFLISRNIKQEVFPEFDLDIVTVSVMYPGASPIEVEDGIIRPIELAISGVDNIKKMTATAQESVGSVTVEIVEGADPDQVLDDIKSEIDRIRTFPEYAEQPKVALLSNSHQVISLVVAGEVPERSINELTERIQDELMSKPNITSVGISAIRPYEISINISEENLRRYNLTLDRVSSIVKQSSLDLAGGSVKTEGGEVLIRTNEKRYTGVEFDSIAVLTYPNGSKVYLGDIATVVDGFEEWDQETKFDGKSAAMIMVNRVGKQTPKDISKTVREYVDDINLKLPESVQVTVWQDWSVILDQRLELLLNNGLIGLFLVLGILALFLEVRLAFWVALGILVSFLGALMFMPMFGVSINMMSLFAFITVLGIVVDDAIVVGENIFVHYRGGKKLQRASIEGTIEISNAVIFAVLTSIVAFSPLLFVSGTMGKFMNVIPIIVIAVLLMSLVESLFILPAHISNKSMENKSPIWVNLEKRRSKFDLLVKYVINKSYVPTLKWVSHNRYTTLAIALGILLITVGFVGGGMIKFVFMPQIERDEVEVSLVLAPGTSYNITRKYALKIQNAGLDLVKEYDAKLEDGKSNLEHMYVSIGQQASFRRRSSGNSWGSNLAQIMVRLNDEDTRNFEVSEFVNKWRERVGEIPGVEKLTFETSMIGRSSDIDIQLSHADYNILNQVIEPLKNELKEYAGVSEIADSYTEGKRELKITLKPEAESLGINETELAHQVRSAFYGSEAMRFQRGRNEIKVMIRYPQDERMSLANIENMRIRTTDGSEIPFKQAAYVEETRGYSVIERTDRKRVIHVTAKVNSKVTTSQDVIEDLENGYLRELMHQYPGLTYDLEGQSRDRNESMSSLGRGFFMAQFVIFSLLAVLFRSYMQPLVVMSAIPFGVVGAIIGHIVLGYNLSLISAFGIVALTGVVVNDSLVMIDFINRERANGMPIREAVLTSGVRRFRPIIMTSLTTFFGLMPIMLETSVQARFLIPMAISLGFGVLFATAITLVLIPALYLILQDIMDLFKAREDREMKKSAIDDEVLERVLIK